MIELQVEIDQKVQLGAKKKRRRVFLSSSSSGSSVHEPVRYQPRMQDKFTQGCFYLNDHFLLIVGYSNNFLSLGFESSTIQEEVFMPIGETLVPRKIEDFTWMNHPVSPAISTLARNLMSTIVSLVSSLPIDRL